MGRIYMIMGKSATGKDHIYEALKGDAALKLKPIILYTTRPQRSGEENGREYYFTNTEHLKELRAAGKIIEERVYPTIHGDWYYFTADEGQIDLSSSYITIGTAQSFIKMRQYFGKGAIMPLYIETEDYLRLKRAIERENKQSKAEFKEVCRRFLADEEDFSSERLSEAGIEKRFCNNGRLEDCIQNLKEYIKEEEYNDSQNRI